MDCGQYWFVFAIFVIVLIIAGFVIFWMRGRIPIKVQCLCGQWRVLIIFSIDFSITFSVHIDYISRISIKVQCLRGQWRVLIIRTKQWQVAPVKRRLVAIIIILFVWKTSKNHHFVWTTSKKIVICFELTWIKFAWQGLRFFVPVWNLIAIFSMKLGLHVKSSGTCLRVLVQSLNRDSVCNIVIATYQKHCNCNISKAQQ